MSAATPWWKRHARLLGIVVFFLGLWFLPVPEGLTREAWHLFAVFAAAIAAVVVNALPLLTAALLAAAIVVLTYTLTPAKAFAAFANPTVLLVVVAFLVAQAVVKCGLGRRISLQVVSIFGGSTLGLAYSIFITDTLIAPGFPSNTARGGVLFPVILGLAQGGGSMPEEESTRRLGGYLMFCGMASLAITSALWLTATSGNPVAVSIAAEYGLKITFGSWLLVSSIPALLTIALLPLLLYRLFPPGVTDTPEAPEAARRQLHTMGPMSRHEWITAATFVSMIVAWILAAPFNINPTAIAIAGFAVALVTGVLTLNDIHEQGGTLVTFIWLAVLFGLSAQLNELGFMSYVGERLASAFSEVSWPVAYVSLLGIYILFHYLFVSQGAHILALLGVFLDVGVKTGVPTQLMAFALMFASSYFSTITPQGGSQNIIFVAAGYLTQGELYRLGLLTTLFAALIFLVVGTPWILWIG
ncbi:DASS family sodium-coupled anion symporter [Accumulibacter sp.]|uniref:DASS family sodium-coupled anion symporter n=1 Tax=Accumulibacter sp. TaxID=2053492 RepID=UPI0025DC0E2E|nr:DASS family sodium-coupled anion symporter [Accumulibacter sp.]MCM8596086.1 anion permease [Accumulibacter sp.]MCM8627013.1 anion permease [Accumulibacter sp.]MDS4050235.1 DASS family sodium-coupled anion symporter [Accumulibacter sp.]